MWGYEDPLPEAAWLQGYVAFYWDRMDAWFDEDEETRGHPRDPYARWTSAALAPRAGPGRGEVVAESHRPLVLSEGHLPNRYYLPRADVPAALLEVSPTHTYCPYKGESSYVHVAGVRDGAWFYADPEPEVARLRTTSRSTARGSRCSSTASRWRPACPRGSRGRTRRTRRTRPPGTGRSSLRGRTPWSSASPSWPCRRS